MPHKRPKAQNYSDPILFLNAVAQYKRQKNPLWSIRGLSKRCGFKSSGYLSMVFSGKRALSPNLLLNLCKKLEISGSEERYLLALVNSQALNNGELEIKRNLTEFSPLFFGTQKADTTLPSEWTVRLKDMSYWIEGKDTSWNHFFEYNETSEQFHVSRAHNHPSRRTDDIRFYSKELLHLSDDWIFIFWPEPTPQFHSFPLTSSIFDGCKTSGSMSGIVCTYWLEHQPKSISERIHLIRHSQRSK